MTTFHYIDNDVAWNASPTGCGEWTSKTEGPGAIIRSADAAYGSGTGFGLRQSGGSANMLKSDLAVSVAPGSQAWIGLWFNQRSAPAADWAGFFLIPRSGPNNIAWVMPSSGYWYVMCADDTFSSVGGATFTVGAGWHYLALGYRRATTAVAADGWWECWLDGVRVLLDSNVNNFSSGANLDQLLVGAPETTDTAFAVDVDEVTIADTRPTGGLSRYHLYCSPAGGRRGDIDYSAPIATIPPGAATRQIAGLGHSAGGDHWYGLRRVSDSGAEERNTHVCAVVRLDWAGHLVPPMAAPCDVTAARRKDGAVTVGFSYRVGEDWPCPDAFDIFTDIGTGTLDLDAPLASIPAAQRKSEYEAVVTPTALPAMFAVRPRIGSTTGPISTAVAVATAAPAQPVPF